MPQNIFADIISNTSTSMSQAITSNGGRLNLEIAGVALSVPEGALPKLKSETFYICVMKEDRLRPKLPEGTFFQHF